MFYTCTMKALFDAVKAGDVDKVNELIANDPAAVDSRDESGITLVQAAVYAFQFGLAQELVAKGATLDLPSACCVGAVETVKTLAEPTTVNELSADGFTPLSLAAAFGGVECVRALVAAGADVNQQGTALGGIAPIHACIFGRRNDVLALLLDSGADPNLKQEGGFTPLMGAAQNGDQAAVTLLLAHGADKDAKANDGKSAADYADGKVSI